MENKSFKKQMPYNLLMNIVSFVVNIFIGLWLVPYLIKYIGVAAYGMVPLAMIFTEYISVITISINGAVTRFLTIEIQKNEWEKANVIFNTSFFTMLGIIIVQIPILAYITVEVSSIFEVPEELIIDAYYLFAFTFAGYLISLLSSIYSTSMYAYNRLDLRKIVDLNRIFVRLVTIVVLFSIFTPSLKIVGIANFAGAVTSFLYASRYWRKLTPLLRHAFQYFDYSMLKNLTGMGGWLIVNQVGFLLFIKVDVFVINKFFGAAATGEYSAVLQWNVLIRTMASVLSNVIGPMLLISFAKNKMDDVVRYGKLGVKFLALGIALMTGIICGLAAPLLQVWLGPDFTQFSTLMVIMLCHLTINLGVLPLFPINTSLNKVKIPGLVTGGMGIFNLLLAIAFVAYFDFGYLGVAMAGAIVITLKNGLFSPWYAAKILNISKSTFYLPLVGGVVVFLFTYVLSSWVATWFVVDSWLMIIICSSITGIVALALTWLVFMDKEDKGMIIAMVAPKLEKVAKKIF
jgi:O-antigen/teichoic acid export membrane protein